VIDYHRHSAGAWGCGGGGGSRVGSSRKTEPRARPVLGFKVSFLRWLPADWVGVLVARATDRRGACISAAKNKLGYAPMDLAARGAGGGGGTPQPPDDAPGFPDGAADGGGIRPAKRARVDDSGGVSAASAAAAAAATTATCGKGNGGSAGGGSTTASTLAPTPLPATVDYVGFCTRCQTPTESSRVSATYTNRLTLFQPTATAMPSHCCRGSAARDFKRWKAGSSC
jgi:hypothetical protein